MNREVHDVALLDASTGERGCVRLTGFCEKPTGTIRVGTTGNWRGQAPNVVTRCLFVLRWNRARRGTPVDFQERKYRLKKNAQQEKQVLGRKGYKEASVTPCEENGIHTIWD